MMEKALCEGLQTLRLNSFLANCRGLAEQFEKEGKSSLTFLEELVNLELEERFHRRIDRLIK